MKKVLLVGDSIRLGYEKYVREELDGKAEVYAHGENAAFSMYTYVRLNTWIEDLELDFKEIDVIHWNNGVWDSCHFAGDEQVLTSPELYAENLERIICRLRKYCPQAKIVFATTTPPNPSGIVGPNPLYIETVIENNQIAKKIMEKNNVAVNDLFAVMADKDASYWKDYVHLTEAGYQLLGKQVAKVVSEAF